MPSLIGFFLDRCAITTTNTPPLARVSILCYTIHIATQRKHTMQRKRTYCIETKECKLYYVKAFKRIDALALFARTFPQLKIKDSWQSLCGLDVTCI